MREEKGEREKEKKFTYLALFLLMFFPVSAVADSVTITNSVSSHASSGGNVSTGSIVTEGKTTNSVSVKTVINGEVVEDYTETSNHPIHYERSIVRTVSTSSVVTQTAAHTSTGTGETARDVVRAGRGSTGESLNPNATHDRAPERTVQSDDDTSSTEHHDIHRASATTTSAAVAVADGSRGDAGSVSSKPLVKTGVATRMFMNMRSIISNIIQFLSW